MFSASAVRINDEINAGRELEGERQQKDGYQSELPRHVAPRQMAGEDRACPRSGKQAADDSHYDGRISDIVPWDEAEQRDRQRISKARMEAAARTCWTTIGRSTGLWRPATDMATNSSR